MVCKALANLDRDLGAGALFPFGTGSTNFASSGMPGFPDDRYAGDSIKNTGQFLVLAGYINGGVLRQNGSQPIAWACNIAIFPHRKLRALAKNRECN